MEDEYIRYQLFQSKQVFQDAELLARNRSWNSCINRLYYSSFYLVNALLLKNDIKAFTHKGIQTKFFLKIIKTNILTTDEGRLYANLYDLRQESDYGESLVIDEITAMFMIEKVREFNLRIIDLINL